VTTALPDRATLKNYLAKFLRSNGHAKPFPNLAASSILSEQVLLVGQPCGLAGTNFRICSVDTIWARKSLYWWVF